jgi:hypothetical protein
MVIFNRSWGYWLELLWRRATVIPVSEDEVRTLNWRCMWGNFTYWCSLCWCNGERLWFRSQSWKLFLYKSFMCIPIKMFQFQLVINIIGACIFYQLDLSSFSWLVVNYIFFILVSWLFSGPAQRTGSLLVIRSTKYS